MKQIYLDFAATTPVDSNVLKKMLPFFNNEFGNPASAHHHGRKAEYAVESSRNSIAQCFNADENEIIFTSCGTESDNLALKGVAFHKRKQTGAHKVFISPVEHHAISNSAKYLRDEFGFTLEMIPVNYKGVVDPDEVRKRIDKNTAIVSIIYANNEIGSINPISEIGKICRESEVAFHTDAVQAVAHKAVNVDAESIDLLSFGGHKFYGPKGVGGLYARKGISFLPQQSGGSQEAGKRSGTLNVPLIVGMAEALELTNTSLRENSQKSQYLRDKIIHSVKANIHGSLLTGDPVNRLPNHASFVFKGVDGNTLIMLLDQAGFSCSSGSACKTGNPEPSEVLLALGLSHQLALSSLRVTVGRTTTEEEVNSFLDILPELVSRAKKTFPL